MVVVVVVTAAAAAADNDDDCVMYFALSFSVNFILVFILKS